MNNEFKDIITSLVTCKPEEVNKIVSERLNDLNRNAENNKVFGNNRIYKNFIGPEAKCFSNPNQKGIYFDDINMYVDMAHNLREFFSNVDLKNVSWEKESLRIVDTVFLQQHNYFYGDYTKKLDRINLQKDFQTEARTSLPKIFHNFDKNIYDSKTKNEIHIKEMQGQEMASGFESAVVMHNMLQFFGLKSELVCGNNQDSVLLHNENGEKFIIAPDAVDYSLFKDNNSDTYNFAMNVVMDKFPNKDAFKEWYYGKKDYVMQSKVIDEIYANMGMYKAQAAFPNVRVSSLNRAKEYVDNKTKEFSQSLEN